jgi:hypothetical protein
MAKVYLDETDVNYIVSSSNTIVYGKSGAQTVIVESSQSQGVPTGITFDQNVGGITFTGASSGYTFEQAGNRIKIYSGNDLVATTAVQGDADGTQLTFSDGTAPAKLTGIVMTIGSETVSDTKTPINVSGTTSTSVAIDSAGTSDASSLDAIFTINSGNYTHNITGFSSGDVLDFPDTNAPSVINSAFGDGTVDLQFADPSTSQVLTITLTGLVNDSVLNSVQDFNAQLGAGTII